MSFVKFFLTTLILLTINSSIFSQKRISANEALDNVGLYVRVCEKVVDGVYLENSPSKVTLLNIGAEYPNQKLTIVISNTSRNNFTIKPEEFYKGKFICVVGRVESRDGKPQIEIFNPPAIFDSVSLNNSSASSDNKPISILPPDVLPKPKTSISKFELGVSLGSMHAYTDIGRKKSKVYLPTEDVKLQGGLFASYTFHKNFAARVEINYGRIAANDANGKPSVQPRSLSFRSNIFEISVLGQLSPITLKKSSLYILGGVGLFSFNPEANYNGNWVKLQPLSTEGQGFPEFPDRKKYRLTQLSIPLGGGMKFDVTPAFSLRFEGLYRLTTTDYLDDASTLFIDKSIFFKNLPLETANIAAAISTPNPSYNKPGSVIRGGANSTDNFFSFSVKLGYKMMK